MSNYMQDPGLIAERTRLTRIKADREQLKLAIEQGQYIAIAEVEKWTAHVITNAKTKLLALPAKLAVKLSGKKLTPEQVSNVLATEILEALNELATLQASDVSTDDI